MTKLVSDQVLNAAFVELRDNLADRLVVCEGAPATFNSANLAKGSGGQRLAFVALSTGDFTIADGDSSGRKVTVGQKAGVTVLVTGAGNHVAILNTTASRLEYLTEATSQNLTAGNTMTFSAWDIEIADPT